MGMWTEFQRRLAVSDRGPLGCVGQIATEVLPILTATALAACPAGAAVDTSIVLTQVPVRRQPTPPDWNRKTLMRADWFEGARLVVISPQGQLRVLSEGFHSACDPNVSFDGERVLFAGKKDRGSHWRIWEMGLDGQGLRPVTPEHLEARSPIYVSTLFTLDSPEPWFTTVFVARGQTVNEAGYTAASSLCNIKLDGTELRRLTFNPNHNFDPFQMWDGRVIYSAERYPNTPNGSGGRVGIYGIHIEGADMERYGGELGGRIQQMPCATERGLIVFVEADDPAWDGAGQLACIQEQRPHVTYQRLTRDRAHRFLYPSPWREDLLLVSRRPVAGKGTCGVFFFDARTRECRLLFDSPDHHDVQAVALKPRNRPDGHSTVVNTRFNTGTFYGLNCYDAERRMARHLQTGMVKRVRFIEGLLQPAPESPHAPLSSKPFVPRRLVGEAPVEADGSFNVEVPADTPLLLQTLDERGLALGSCGWIWVKPKETRGCIGCHEDPERVPENEYVLALRRPSNRLTLPPEERRSVSLLKDVVPVLKARCAASDCHGGKKTPLHLPLTAENPSERELQETYAALTAATSRKTTSPGLLPGKYVDAGRARTSWLMWQLLGTNTSRPWDRDHKLLVAPAGKIRPMPPPNSNLLSEQELRTMAQWIDLGAQYEAVTTPRPMAATREEPPR
jgi:hypothetical protein